MQLHKKGEILRGLHVASWHIIKEHQMCIWTLHVHCHKTNRFPCFWFTPLYAYIYTKLKEVFVCLEVCHIYSVAKASYLH